MGRKPTISQNYRRFISQVDSALKLAEEAAALRKAPRESRRGLHKKQFLKIIELCFLQVLESYESYCLDCMIKYTAGATGLNGITAKAKVGVAASIEDARIIVGRVHGTSGRKSYISFSDSKSIRETARFLFGSVNPFEATHSKNDLLKKAYLIRNRIVHNSNQAGSGFREAANFFKQFPGEKLPQGYTPGAILDSPSDRHFPEKYKGSGKTIFISYCEILKDLATAIANPKNLEHV